MNIKKINLQTGVQIFTLIYLIINILYILPVFILLALSLSSNPLEFDPARYYFVSMLFYVALRLTYFNILFAIIFIVLYISQFAVNKRLNMFIFSLIIAISDIAGNVMWIIIGTPMTVQ